MATTRVQVDFDDRALRTLMTAVGGPVYTWMRDRTNDVERQAKANAPYRTGRLRASISSTLDVQRGRLVGIVGSDVDYAGFVELGTRYMRAQPYLRPALRQVLGL